MQVKNYYFYVITMCIAGLGTGLLYYLGYEHSFLFLNQFHSAWGNFIFGKLTHLGDGITMTAIFWFFYGQKEPQKMLSTILCIAFTGVVVQLLKQMFFSEWYRPLVSLPKEMVHSVAGYEAYGQSFPSGHSTAVFSFVFSILLWQKWSALIQVFWALLACLVAYSRIYLGVHFLGDVLAGALLAWAMVHLTFPHLYAYVSRLFISSYRLRIFLHGMATVALLAMFIFRVILEKNF